jgi:tRNA pseudouridine38-40 synthase
MRDAAQALVGTHDFKAFTVLEPEVSSTVRTIHAAGVDDAITIRITADGFLRFMVRRIAGSLIEIGRGKIDRESIRRALEPSFEEARWTAPAKGLVLEEIRY